MVLYNKKLNGGDIVLDRQDIKVVGTVIHTLYKSNGTIEVHRKDNIIVQDGFDFICDAIGNSQARPACMGWIAVGSGNLAPTTGDHALGTEILRKSATYSHVAGTKVFTFSTTFNPGEATGGIMEAAVFNAVSGGKMFDRVTFAIINKGADDTLTTQFQFTLV
jgi:hypothetical protein